MVGAIDDADRDLVGCDGQGRDDDANVDNALVLGLVALLLEDLLPAIQGSKPYEGGCLHEPRNDPLRVKDARCDSPPLVVLLIEVLLDLRVGIDGTIEHGHLFLSLLFSLHLVFNHLTLSGVLTPHSTLGLPRLLSRSLPLRPLLLGALSHLPRRSLLRLLEELPDGAPRGAGPGASNCGLLLAVQAAASAEGLDATELVFLASKPVEYFPVLRVAWRRGGGDPLFAIGRHRGAGIGQREGAGKDTDRAERAGGVLAEYPWARGPHVADERPHVHPHCKVQ
mmetsp:Transcript_112043/g.282027  ORF Transcript_112043/g.282027 Transcript_112043/m.282027 type:complete len:281 (+) Transcript_112043:431-1273(+)